MRIHFTLAFVASAIVSSGCGAGGSSAGDAAELVDVAGDATGPFPDAAVDRDAEGDAAGVTVDLAVAPTDAAGDAAGDAVTTPDAGPDGAPISVDAGADATEAPADAAERIDAVGAVDGPSVTDARAQLDAVLPEDAVAAVDAAIEVDAALVADAAEQADAGMPGPDFGFPECETDGDCFDFRRCVAAVCRAPEVSALAQSLVLNEFLIDGALDEDANGDGDIHPTDDEFVELVNVGAVPLDLGGCILVESDLLAVPRHTIAAGFTLPPGEALVIFGGGEPDERLVATPGAHFQVSNAADPAFSNGLNLDDDGDTFRMLDPAGDEVFVYSYGDLCDRPPCDPAVSDRSMTRAPELSGRFVPHDQVGPGPMSPGRRADETPFVGGL